MSNLKLLLMLLFVFSRLNAQQECDNDNKEIVFVNTENYEVYVVLDKMPENMDFFLVDRKSNKKIYGVCEGIRTYKLFRFQQNALQNESKNSINQGNFKVNSNSSIDTVHLK